MSQDQWPHSAVVKVGGSLYDLPDLGLRLRRWLQESQESQVLLVPGGGVTADAVRTLDRWQHLGEDRAHWLAIRALGLNAWLLHGLLAQSTVIERLEQVEHCWGQGLVPILDCWQFCQEDEARPGRLPHTWQATSDAIAARVAQVLGARRLYLLKSADMPADWSWQQAAERGLVDPLFAQVVRSLEVHVVRLR